MTRPVIAIPLGDPAGIGPEIVIKALADPAVRQSARCVVVDCGVLGRAGQASPMAATRLTVKYAPAYEV